MSVVAAVGLLGLGLVAVAGVGNAIRPARAWWAIAPSWIAAWITVELAPHLVALSAAAAVGWWALGGLDHLAGWIGLGLLVAADGVAAVLIWRARRTVVDLGEVVEELEDPAPEARRYPRSHVWLPFLVLRRRDVRIVRGIEYSRPEGVGLRLDAYLPHSEPEAACPAVVQVHGGGWTVGSRFEQGVPLLTHLAANGWVGFSIDYRLSPFATWPDHLVDVKRAIAWVREHADDYGADPGFVAVTGGSAGGHLAAMAALTAGDRSLQPGFEGLDASVAACVPFYGVYDLLDEDRIHVPALHRIVLEPLVLKARRSHRPELFRDASPLHRVHEDAPPTFVIHGRHDSLIPVAEARRFAARLREVSRNPVLYAEMQGGQHAFDIIPSWRTVPVVEAIERFLATVRRREQEGGERSVEKVGADLQDELTAEGAGPGSGRRNVRGGRRDATTG